MEYFSFAKLVYENIDIYLSCLVIVTILNFIVNKRLCFSIIDPMVVIIFMISIYTGTIVFLMITGNCSIEFMCIYFLCYIALLFGLNINGKIEKINFMPKFQGKENKLIKCFVFVTTLLMYGYLVTNYGVPLLVLDSDRATFYNESGKLYTIYNVFLAIMEIMIVDEYFHYKNKNWTFFVVVFAMLFFCGSKSAFSTLIFLVVIYLYYYTDYVFKFRFKILVCFVIMVFLFFTVVLIQHDYDMDLAFGGMVFAWSNRADTFVYFASSDYSDIIKFFDGSLTGFLKDLFYIPLSNIGLVSGTSNFFSGRLETYIYGGEGTLGPNANIIPLSLVHLGEVLCIVTSGLVGFLISFIRNKLGGIITHDTIVKRIVFMSIQINTGSLIAAPTLFVGNMIHMICILFGMNLLFMAYYKICK